MTINQFVDAVKIQTSDAAVLGTMKCLKSPPGRKPRPELVRLSEWFHELSVEDSKKLQSAMKEAAEMAIFQFLCILDGVSVIEDTPEKGELELFFVKGTERIRLNDPQQMELHNVFNSSTVEGVNEMPPNPAVKAYDTDKAGSLRRRLKRGDGLDIHHVPDKYLSLKETKGYDPTDAPAVALPKVEHRQLFAGTQRRESFPESVAPPNIHR